MTPTRRGLSIAVVDAVLYGLAWATSIGWFFVADSLVWAILLVNLSLPWLNVRGISAERRPITSTTGQSTGGQSTRGKRTAIFEQDTVKIAIELRNRSLLPKFFVTVKEDCPIAAPDSRRRGFLLGTIPPRGHVTVDYDVLCHRRGRYSFGPARLETSAPFGLFRARRTADAELTATVYPQVFPMDPSFSQGPIEGHVPDNSPPGPSGEFRGSREFQQSDRRRNIHWRSSAKRGELMVREFDQLPQGEVRLAFNPELDIGRDQQNTLEYAIKVAASVAGRCFQDGRPFRMWPRVSDRPVTTWFRVLEHLARLQPSTQPSILEMLRQSNLPGASLAIVSSADRDSVAMLHRYRAAARYTTVLLLEGFARGEDPALSTSLPRMGFQVVRCGPGELPEAIASLSATMSIDASGVSLTSVGAN